MSIDQANPYRLIRLMARGVSGDVHRARRVTDEKIVAVKVFHRSAGDDPDFARVMIQSAFRAKEFNNPAAVGVHECIASSGKVLLATELIEGEVLARVLQRNTRLPAKSVLAVVKKSAEVLHLAALAGLHHGRLSPAKMFVGTSGRLKLLGTGLYSGRPTAPQPHPAGYTWPAHYVAPEVLDGTPTSETSDVYSLGAIAYHLLTGVSPFVCERLSSLKVEKMSPVEWPGEIARDVDAGLLMLVERMTAPMAAERPNWARVQEEIAALRHPARAPRVLPRIRQPVPEEASLAVEAADTAAGAKESPFLLPVLVSLLFLVAATGVILKIALDRPAAGNNVPKETTLEATEIRPGSRATPPVVPDAGPPDTQVSAASADTRDHVEDVESLLATVEEMERNGSASVESLLAEYERIAAQHDGTPAAIKARSAAGRLRGQIEQARLRLVDDLRKQVDAALSRSSPRDALLVCDTLLKQEPGLEEARKEKERIVSALPQLYSQLQTTAELYAAQGNYRAAIQFYGKVIGGFPAGEWQARAELAIRRLEELEERRNEVDEARKRREAQENDKAAFDEAIKRVYGEASAFRYAGARHVLEQTHSAIADTALKRALNLYRDALVHEESLFISVNNRLTSKQRDVMVKVPGEEDVLTVVEISDKGVELRTDISQMLYPWTRLSEYQKLRLFQICMDEESAVEWLGLASVAFHHGLYGEVQNNLSMVIRMDKGQLADTAVALQSLFDEISVHFRRPRGRGR